MMARFKVGEWVRKKTSGLVSKILAECDGGYSGDGWALPANLLEPAPPPVGERSGYDAGEETPGYPRPVQLCVCKHPYFNPSLWCACSPEPSLSQQALSDVREIAALTPTPAASGEVCCCRGAYTHPDSTHGRGTCTNGKFHKPDNVTSPTHLPSGMPVSDGKGAGSCRPGEFGREIVAAANVQALSKFDDLFEDRAACYDCKRLHGVRLCTRHA